MPDSNVHPLFKPILDQAAGLETKAAGLEAQIAGYAAAAETACAAMKAAQQRIEDLRDALHTYGWHLEKCPAHQTMHQLLHGAPNGQECTCGFDASTAL